MSLLRPCEVISWTDYKKYREYPAEYHFKKTLVKGLMFSIDGYTTGQVHGSSRYTNRLFRWRKLPINGIKVDDLLNEC